MRVGRDLIVSAILSLGVAGSLLAGPTMTVAAGPVAVAAASAHPNMVLRG
jgi:hypothetical protein